MSLSGAKDNLCKMPRTLLQAGNEAKDKKRDALLGSAHDIQASCNGNTTPDGWVEVRAHLHNQEIGINLY